MDSCNLVNPPFRYQMVEENVFRGTYPKDRNLFFLKRLNLKTILSLTSDPPKNYLLDFCNSNQISSIHFKVEKPKDNLPLTYQKVSSILQIIVDEKNLPIYIHCLDGTLITGVVVGCLRKLQCWTVQSAMMEYSRISKDGIIGSEEAEFVEKFQGEVEIPITVPPWLWGGIINYQKRHPSLRLKYQQPTSLQQVSSNLRSSNDENNADSPSNPSKILLNNNQSPANTPLNTLVLQLAKEDLRRQSSIVPPEFSRQGSTDSNQISLRNSRGVAGLSTDVIQRNEVNSLQDDEEEPLSLAIQALALEFSGSFKKNL
ncbi:hypothetical protein HK099_004721 [Clydaea vesicula]|uniref:Uncharacterized protein n=1 Tax=Clydaea vesicula TaxID=447962 RepID=A0AAD5Y038_9FUNG|nr:hypothetical protein HK099_004721 [Clydaea vesicula]